MNPGDLVTYDSKKFPGEHRPGIILSAHLDERDREMARILWNDGRIFDVYLNVLEVISEAR